MPAPIPAEADRYTIKIEVDGEPLEVNAPIGYERAVGEAIDSEAKCLEIQELADGFHRAAGTALELNRAAISFAADRGAEAATLSRQAHRLFERVSSYRVDQLNTGTDTLHNVAAAAVNEEEKADRLKEELETIKGKHDMELEVWRRHARDVKKSFEVLFLNHPNGNDAENLNTLKQLGQVIDRMNQDEDQLRLGQLRAIAGGFKAPPMPPVGSPLVPSKRDRASSRSSNKISATPGSGSGANLPANTGTGACAAATAAERATDSRSLTRPPPAKASRQVPVDPREHRIDNICKNAIRNSYRPQFVCFRGVPDDTADNYDPNLTRFPDEAKLCTNTERHYFKDVKGPYANSPEVTRDFRTMKDLFHLSDIGYDMPGELTVRMMDNWNTFYDIFGDVHRTFTVRESEL